MRNAQDPRCTCDGCGAELLASELEHPDPEDDTDTQYGWLHALCPKCGAAIPLTREMVRAVIRTRGPL